MSQTRGKSKTNLAGFLVTRGLWLLLLEFTLVHLGWTFNFYYLLPVGQVIYAIGGSMILLSLLVFLPTPVVAILGLTIVGCHNLLDGIEAKEFGNWSWLWTLFVRSGEIDLPYERKLFIGYPILPWLGIMMSGYGFGAIWMLQRRMCRLIMLGMGLALIGAFLVLASLDRYGDPHKWAWHAESFLFTVFSFIDCTKYPPSLLYALMTLGPAIVMLALLDRSLGSLRKLMLTFGRVPMFFYLLHVPLIHTLALLFALYQYDGEVGFLFQNISFGNAVGVPKDYGYRLWVVYVVWFLVLGILYPLCAWFAEVKSRSRAVWLSYF